MFDVLIKDLIKRKLISNKVLFKGPYEEKIGFK